MSVGKLFERRGRGSAIVLNRIKVTEKMDHKLAIIVSDFLSVPPLAYSMTR